MKSKYRFLLLMICALALMVVSAFSLAACGSDAEIFYLSVGDTYKSEKDIPENYKFSQSEDNKNIYSLEISMESDTQFTVKEIGSEEAIGYSSLFTAANKLTIGENDNCKVVYDGVYVLRYDVGTKILTYSYKANITGISIVAPSSVLRIGESLRFAAEVEQSDGESNADVTWTSSDSSVATISNVGVVKALTEGEVTLTAKAGDFSDEVTISVLLPETDATGIDVTPKTLSLEVGETEQLTATVSPRNASQNVSWWVEEDEQSIITVSVTGVVKAVGSGTATVHVVTASGLFEAECEVTVIKHVDLIKISASTLRLVANGQQKTLSVSVSPSDATDSSYTYSFVSGSEHVAIEKDAEGNLLLSGVSEGEASLMVVSSDNQTAVAVCSIEVLAASSSAADILPQNRQMMIGENIDLEVNLEGKTIQSVEWSVDHGSVVSVAAGEDAGKAKVTANSFGSAIVTANVTDSDGNEYTTTCNILVTDDFYFVYGYGIGAYDWDYQDYLTDRNAAEKAGILFKEEEAGIYSLTRHFALYSGFQIVFPKVTQFTERDNYGRDIWNKNIPSQVVSSGTYYDSSRSDSSYVYNKADAFQVTSSGVYTVYLDLTGESAKVYITMLSVDVEELELTLDEGNALLREGESAKFGITCTPQRATFTEEDVRISLTSDFEQFADYVDYRFNFTDKSIYVTAKADPSQAFRVDVHCEICGVETSFEVTVYPSDKPESPVTSITFEKSHYSFNVNNGGEAWEIPVRAHVNEQATIQDVRYSVLSVVNGNLATNYYVVDSVSGIVTSKNTLGTVEIGATAVGDNTISATCTVTFYSDVFYLAGNFNELNPVSGYQVPGAERTTLEGTLFEDYQFTQKSETYYVLETTLQASGGNWGLQIAHLGMGETWGSALTAASRNASGIYDWYTYFDTWGDNLRIKQEGDYVIEVNLEGVRAKFTINPMSTELQEIMLSSDASELKAGESAKVKVQFGPEFKAPDATAIQWTLAGDGATQVTYQFDYASRICTLTANTSDFSEDKTVTLTCSVAGVEAQSVTFTIIAQHHLKWDADNENHWQVCTDNGCDYQSNPEMHDRDSTWDFDGKYHFHACDVCGEGRVDEHEHNFTVYAGGWYVGEGICNICNFHLYTVEDGVITKYNGQFTKLRIPATIGGVVITGIGAQAFTGNQFLVEVELPDTITQIGHISIGTTGAFSECKSLVRVVMKGVTEIPKALFDQCTSLTTVEYGDLVSIDRYAFRDTAIKTFAVPDTLTSIGAYAFSGTSVEVTWGEHPKLLRLGGFGGWLGTEFEIPANIQCLDSVCFSGAVNLQKIIVPDNVTQVVGSAFNGCTSLEYAELGVGVDEITSAMFTDCVSLRNVLCRSNKFWLISLDSFRGCTSLQAVYIKRSAAGLASCPHLIGESTGNNVLLGKCYAYSDTPDTEPLVGKFTKYFAGCWHYDDSGEQTLENVVVWTQADVENAISVTPAQVTLYIDPKRN